MGLREEAAALRREAEKLEAQAEEESRTKELERLGELWLPSHEEEAARFVRSFGDYHVNYADAELAKLILDQREAGARRQRIEIRQRAADAEDAAYFTEWCIQKLEPR